ncbi:MAG: Rossmann-like and DUF2520 domain-containing protein [Nonlabens sp.]
MIRIFIVGTGNLGTHLCRWFDGGNDPLNHDAGGGSAFAKAESSKTSREYELVGYLNKSGARLDRVMAQRVEDFDSIPSCDLILLAVPDDRVKDVSENLPITDAVVAHTSGSVSMDVLSKHENHGVFYLPQSFSKSRTPHFKEIPVCLEYFNKKSQFILETSSKFVSDKIHHMDSAQRKELHLAAVYVNNFVNHCYLKSQKILENAGIDTGLLNPLMRETFLKALDLQPKNAQTGPAIRNDQKTITAHLELLPEKERELYRVLTQSIQKEHLK